MGCTNNLITPNKDTRDCTEQGKSFILENTWSQAIPLLTNQTNNTTQHLDKSRQTGTGRGTDLFIYLKHYDSNEYIDEVLVRYTR